MEERPRLAGGPLAGLRGGDHVVGVAGYFGGVLGGRAKGGEGMDADHRAGFRLRGRYGVSCRGRRIPKVSPRGQTRWLRVHYQPQNGCPPVPPPEMGTGISLRWEPVPISIGAPRREPGGTAVPTFDFRGASLLALIGRGDQVTRSPVPDGTTGQAERRGWPEEVDCDQRK